MKTKKKLVYINCIQIMAEGIFYLWYKDHNCRFYRGSDDSAHCVSTHPGLLANNKRMSVMKYVEYKYCLVQRYN